MAGIDLPKLVFARLAACVAFVISARAEVRIEAVPRQADFQFPYGKASDFSGITWVRGKDFFIVSNQEQALFPLRLELRADGTILAALVGARVPVKSGFNDFEGIAYLPARDRFYVSTERPPGIVGFDLAGDARFQVEVPKVFGEARKNKGLESLAYGAGALWTANEDTLSVDGSTSSRTSGALIRLQKFDDRFRPVAQFAYRTESSLLRAGQSGTGVTDLAVLPGGELLVLERVVGLGLSARIFQIDIGGATDTTRLGRLTSDNAVPVKKKLLFERNTGTKNFEGMALGPELEAGWRSLILIEDNGGGDQHTLIPLRLKSGAPEPAR